RYVASIDGAEEQPLSVRKALDEAALQRRSEPLPTRVLREQDLDHEVAVQAFGAVESNGSHAAPAAVDSDLEERAFLQQLEEILARLERGPLSVLRDCLNEPFE